MESQLFQACTDGDLSILKCLISKHGLNCIDDEVKDSSGYTPLHLACMHGHLHIIYYLIREQNCNPEATTSNGRTPLHLACKYGHLRIAKCLITEYKCNPHCTDNTGYTPLHAASESDNLDSVKYLITENGCDPKVSDSVGNTPLHYASKSGHLNIVQCLIMDFRLHLWIRMGKFLWHVQMISFSNLIGTARFRCWNSMALVVNATRLYPQSPHILRREPGT